VKSVLFVCTGNICRSPIAEGLFQRLIGNRKDIEVTSAGVHAVRGQPPSLYAVQVCEKEGVSISNLRSQPLTHALVDRATHIFAMTGAHRLSCSLAVRADAPHRALLPDAPSRNLPC